MQRYPMNAMVQDIPAWDSTSVNRDLQWGKLIVGIDADPANKEKITHWGKRIIQFRYNEGFGVSYRIPAETKLLNKLVAKALHNTYVYVT